MLKPLHDVVPLKRVHVATYQSVSGAGAQRMEQLRAEPPSEHNLVMDWDWEGDESDEESKLAPRRARSWSCPTSDQRDLRPGAGARRPLRGDLARVRGAAFARGRHRDPERGSERARLRLPEVPTPKDAAGGDEVLVGRIRKDEARRTGSRSSSRATTSEREPR